MVFGAQLHTDSPLSAEIPVSWRPQKRRPAPPRDPGGAASRCSEPPLVVTPSPLRCFLSPHQAAPVFPPGERLQSAQRPRAPTGRAGRGSPKAGRPRPRRPGPCSCNPKPYPRRLRSAWSLGRRTWVSQELEAEWGYSGTRAPAGTLRGPAQPWLNPDASPGPGGAVCQSGTCSWPLLAPPPGASLRVVRLAWWEAGVEAEAAGLGSPGFR